MTRSRVAGTRCHLALTAVLAVALLFAPAAPARHQPSGPRTPPRTTETPVVVVESSDGFDWGDAGLGAGTAVGLVLLAVAAATTVRRQRRVSTSR